MGSEMRIMPWMESSTYCDVCVCVWGGGGGGAVGGGGGGGGCGGGAGGGYLE